MQDPHTPPLCFTPSFSLLRHLSRTLTQAPSPRPRTHHHPQTSIPSSLTCPRLPPFWHFLFTLPLSTPPAHPHPHRDGFQHSHISVLCLSVNPSLIHTFCIKPDTPINVYTRFCLNTAKSKFSLVSPVADW